MVVDDVIQAYKIIMRKLGEKPNTIEHVFEIREWMESIPFALKTQEDIMRRVHTVSWRRYSILGHSIEQEETAAHVTVQCPTLEKQGTFSRETYGKH